jgi:hypothetical protein
MGDNLKKTALCLIAAYLAVMISIWSVKSATSDGRWYSTMFMMLIGFAIVIAVVIAQVGPKDAQVGPTETKDVNQTRGLHHLVGAITGVFIASIFLASALTHASPGVGAVGSLGSLLAGIGSMIFPVVGKYATMMQLDEGSLFKVQAVMTIFMLGSILNGSFIAAVYFLLPSPARRQRRSEFGGPPLPPIASALVILFFIFLVCDAYFGWSEFDESARGMSLDAKFCATEAFCYLKGSDLMLFAVAALKSLLIGSFPFFCAFFADWFYHKALGLNPIPHPQKSSRENTSPPH